MGSTSALCGRRILVVEDEYVVAMDARFALTECGADVVGPASTLGEALAQP